MNKEEALKKIEELQEFVESLEGEDDYEVPVEMIDVDELTCWINTKEGNDALLIGHDSTHYAGSNHSYTFYLTTYENLPPTIFRVKKE